MRKEPTFTRFRVAYSCVNRWHDIEKARRVLGYEPIVDVCKLVVVVCLVTCRVLHARADNLVSSGGEGILPASSPLKCTSPAEVYLLLKSSDFITHVLAVENVFDGCEDPPPSCELEGAPKYSIKRIVAENEAISQRNHNYYDFLNDPLTKSLIAQSVLGKEHPDVEILGVYSQLCVLRLQPNIH
ncbi:hypothetical protein H0H93_012012 [Arthromyces matolae]|nr:hypothetical protein H0H93_012012 [Arthromyces matolae]